jgi:hypothetical protein
MKLWHDDVRRPPDDSWTWARDNRTAVWWLLDRRLNGYHVEEASLDHDLGAETTDGAEIQSYLARGQSPDGDGVDLVKAMIALRIVPPKVTIHSWNPDGASYMAGLLESLSGADVTVCPWRVPEDHCPLCASSLDANQLCGNCGYPVR